MAQPLEAPCPILPLNDGCRIVLEARDATTGNAVTGVFVNNVAIYGVNLADAQTVADSGPFMWLPGPEQ